MFKYKDTNKAKTNMVIIQQQAVLIIKARKMKLKYKHFYRVNNMVWTYN